MRPASRTGQALIELCLVLPLLLAIASSICDIGIMIYEHIQMTRAMQVVTQVAGANQYSEAQLQTLFDANLQLNISRRTFTVTTSAADATFNGKPSATIDVTYNHAWAGVFRWQTTTSGVNLTSHASFPVTTAVPVPALIFPP